MKNFTFLTGLACALPLLVSAHVLRGNQSQVVRADDAQIRYVGRTQVAQDGTVTFNWAGTYLESHFTGGKLSVRLSETGTSYYNIFVDDQLHKVVKACGTDTVIQLVDGVSRGKHKFRMQKRTEGEFGTTSLHAFLLGMRGTMSAVATQPSRHIEFIGNSLTCGYGVEGLDRDEPFKLETENCYYSFSNLIPRYFDADYTLIAHSGRGVIRNYGDSVRLSKGTMNDRLLHTFDQADGEDWNFQQGYRPDLVVINLGTNDFSTEPHPYKSEFVKGYQQMLTALRKCYGDIPILCVFCNTIPESVFPFYEEAVKGMNDPHIHLFRMQADLTNETSDLGAVWHPSKQGHRKMAMTLIPYIATLMGWNLK